MALGGLRRRRTKSAIPRYPLGVEIQYIYILKSIPKRFNAVATNELNNSVPRILNEINGFKQDAGWSVIFFALLQLIADQIGPTLIQALNSVSQVGRNVNSANNMDWQRQVSKAYGVNILRGEPQLSDALALWERENLALIKSMPDVMIERLRGLMTKGFLEGASLRDLTKIVQDTTNIGMNRAELIARDQVGKLNGQLTRMRQQAIGVEEYVWRTSQDERVRPTHRVRNGKTYRWDSSEIKPGSEIRCRCIAEPVFPEVFGNQNLAVRRVG